MIGGCLVWPSGHRAPDTNTREATPMQYKQGQTEHNIDAYLEWDSNRHYWIYQDWSADFYFSDNAGGGDETFDSLAERIAEADDLGVMSYADRLAVAFGLYKRLKAQGRIFGEWGEETGEPEPFAAAPENPEWADD